MKLISLMLSVLFLNSINLVADDNDIDRDYQDVKKFNKRAYVRRGNNPQSRHNKDSEYSGDIQMGRVRIGGSGCDANTVSTSLTDDKKTLSILFDEYMIEAGENRQKVARKNCHIIIPLKVPANMQVAVVQMDYRGYVLVPKNGQAVLATGYDFDYLENNRGIARGRGGLQVKGSARRYPFIGPVDEEFFVEAELHENPMYSRCGENMNFIVQTQIAGKTNNNFDPLLMMVDSADAIASLSDYHLLWKKCRPNEDDRRRGDVRFDRRGNGLGRGQLVPKGREFIR